MIVVNDYGDSIVEFYCSKCNFHGEYDVKSMISDNCVIDIDIICDICGDLCILYVLKCTDPAQAKELNARLEFLKYKRAAEDENNGDQADESR